MSFTKSKFALKLHLGTPVATGRAVWEDSAAQPVRFCPHGGWVGAMEGGNRERAGPGGTYLQCSPHRVVPLEWGAPLLLFPAAAQLRPLQLQLQLGDLAAQRKGEGRQVKQSRSASGPASQAWLHERPPKAHRRDTAANFPAHSASAALGAVMRGPSGKLGAQLTRLLSF